MTEINGVLNLYKEPGITSFSATRKAGRILGSERAGHTGTLDPMAEGVLVICIGKATRISGLLMASEKEYRATMLLGLHTDTHDIQGKILDIDLAGHRDRKTLEACLDQFLGKQLQRPPLYSAKKVGGKKLLEYARNSQKVDVPEYEIVISRLDLIGFRKEQVQGVFLDAVEMYITCSKGTYIRSLCRDIGEKLGTFGAMTSLCRTRNGFFRAETAVTLSGLEAAAKNGTAWEILLPPEKVLDMDQIVLSADEAIRYDHGIPFRKAEQPSPGDYLVMDGNDRLVGIGTVGTNGFLKGKKRLT